MSEPKSISELLMLHQYRRQDHCTIAYRAYCHCGWTQDVAGTHKSELALHADHVTNEISRGATIEGDWETVRDALDALPEGAQIRWRTGMANRPELAIHRGHHWHSTNGPQPIDSDNIARDETPIEVIA